MSLSDKNNRIERVWHDPPMVDEPTEKPFTLGAGVSPEIKRAFMSLEQSCKKTRLISTITIAAVFTVMYAIMTLLPDTTTVDILNGFIAMTIVTIVVEVGRYYKLV